MGGPAKELEEALGRGGREEGEGQETDMVVV